MVVLCRDIYYTTDISPERNNLSEGLGSKCFLKNSEGEGNISKSSTFWRLPLPLQSRWRYKLHHVLSDSVPSVQSVQVWSDAFLLEARRQKTVEKQKFLLYWNFLSESIWRTTNLNKTPLICKLLKVSTYPNVAFIVSPFKSFLLAHMIIPQPIWKVIWPECSSLYEVQSRFKLGKYIVQFLGKNITA